MVVFTAIGAGILGTVVGGAIFGGLSAFAVGLITTVVLGAALRALTPKPSIGGNRGYQTTAIGTALDHQVVYGKMRVGGARIYDESTGTTNQYLHRIIAVAGHEIQSFDTLYINESYVNLADIAADGNIPTVVEPDGTTSTRYNGKLRVKFHLGSPTQAADATLVSESDSLWTSSCKLSGIAYMYLRMEYSQDVYPDGIPEFTVIVKGKKVFDPRSNSTSWSDNPALCIRDYLTSSYGISEVAGNIDDTLVNSAANVCDQTNTDAGTTRYTCNGAFTTASTPYDMINAMLTSMDGSLWYSQGKWRMKPAYWTTPVLDLNEDDLRSSINVSTRHSRRSNFNTVKGTFRGAESNWQTTDYPQVTSTASLAADNNQVSVADVDLTFTDNSIEAKRIARITLERNRQQLTVTASFGLKTLRVQVGDNVRLSNTRFGWTNKEFEVVSWNFGLTDGLDLQTQLTLRETAETVYDEADDGAAYERDNTNLPSPFGGLQVSGLTTTAGGKLTSDGTFINSAILSWTAAPNYFLSYYEVQWKAAADADYASTTTTNTTIELSPLIDQVLYNFRVRAVSVNGVQGTFVGINFTGGGDLTAPGIPTSVSGTGGILSNFISWVNPTDADFKVTEVYVNTTNSTTGATAVGTSAGTGFTHIGLTGGATLFYFVKAVDYSGNKSAFSTGTGGVVVQSDPTSGAAGDTVITGRVYFGTLRNTSPGNPTATSYNTATATFTGLTTGWSTVQPTISITDTSVQEWSSAFTVTIDGTTAAQTLVFTTATGAIQVAADIESDNFVSGTSGWKIERSTGDAEFQNATIRGTLNAEDITVGTLNAARIPTLSTSKFDIFTGDTIGTNGNQGDPANSGDVASVTFTPTAASVCIVQVAASITCPDANNESTYDMGFVIDVNGTEFNTANTGTVFDGGNSNPKPISIAYGFAASANTLYTIKCKFSQGSGKRKATAATSGALTAIFTQA